VGSDRAFRSRLVVFLAPLLALLTLFGPVVPASAHTLYSRKSPHSSGEFLYLPSWRSFGTSSWAWNHANNALYNWYNTPTLVYPYRTGDYAESVADWYVTYTSDSAWGWTVLYPGPNASCTGCEIAWGEIFLNERTLVLESYSQITKVATHEFGHAFGLGHPRSSVPYRSVMKQGRLSYNTPQTHDINDANRYYP